MMCQDHCSPLSPYGSCPQYHQGSIGQGPPQPLKVEIVKNQLFQVEDNHPKLLEFCLKNTHFSFQGQFYEPKVEGAANGFFQLAITL